MTPTERAAIEQHKKFCEHIAMKAAELESRRVEVEPPKAITEISPKLSPSNKFDKWVENWASDPANAHWISVANKPSTWLKYPPVKLIIGVVCRHFNVRRHDLLSQRRHAQYVWARQVGMFIAKEMTKKSLPEIGREFGDRDHTTVLHAVRKVDLRKDDPDVRFDLDEVRSQVMREFA